MYPTQAGEIGGITDVNTLYSWHLQDPLDAQEITGNNRIESAQGNRNPYIDFSNLVFDTWIYSNSCAEPIALDVSELGTESVRLLWHEAGDATLWKLEYGPQGFDQGSGTLVNVLDPTYLHDGLTSNTSYDFYVQAN